MKTVYTYLTNDSKATVSVLYCTLSCFGNINSICRR